VPHRGQRDGVVVRAPAEPPAATADGPRSESNPGDVEISTPPEETRAAGQKRFAQAAATGASTRGSANRVDVDYRWVAAAAPTVLRLRQLGQPDDRHWNTRSVSRRPVDSHRRLRLVHGARSRRARER